MPISRSLYACHIGGVFLIGGRAATSPLSLRRCFRRRTQALAHVVLHRNRMRVHSRIMIREHATTEFD